MSQRGPVIQRWSNFCEVVSFLYKGPSGLKTRRLMCIFMPLMYQRPYRIEMCCWVFFFLETRLWVYMVSKGKVVFCASLSIWQRSFVNILCLQSKYVYLLGRILRENFLELQLVPILTGHWKVLTLSWIMQDFTSQQTLIHRNAELRQKSWNPAIVLWLGENSGLKVLNEEQVPCIIAFLILCIYNNIYS